MDAVLSAFALVFTAELGDKSMLLAAALTARYRPLPVLGGVTAAAVLMLGLSSLIGAAIGAALPERALLIGGGVLFVGFALWTLRGESGEDDHTEVTGRSIMLGVMVMFLVAELGDKSMIATAALAGNQPPIPTWIGASLGMTLASGAAIAVTATVGRKIPQHVLRYIAAAMFLGFGVFMLYAGITA